jgi:ribosome-associated translation inhibitor RaiA
MQIQVNSDKNIGGRETLAADISEVVDHALSHFRDRITRVEVHVTDQNSDKKGGGDDVRCLMEARLKGRQPVVASHQAANLDQAVDGAADKLSKAIESIIGRLRDHKGRKTDTSARGPEIQEES